MSQKKLPAFQFYPGDWRKDPAVQALDFESRGIWFEILLLMHESEQRGQLLLNGQAMPDEALAQVLGLDQRKVNETLTKLLAYGVASREQTTGALINRRMLRDQAVIDAHRAAGRTGGQASAQLRLKQKATSSSSSSSSSSLKEKSLKRKVSYPNGFEVSEAVKEWAKENYIPDPDSHLEAFKDHHISKGSQFTDWDAAFRTWLRNAKKWDQNAKGPQPERAQPHFYKAKTGEKKADPKIREGLKTLVKELTAKMGQR